MWPTSRTDAPRAEPRTPRAAPSLPSVLSSGKARGKRGLAGVPHLSKDRVSQAYLAERARVRDAEANLMLAVQCGAQRELLHR